jgi:L-lactate dehydrogenase (cytochrome)
MIWQALTHPVWSMGTLRHGMPRLRMMDGYLKIDKDAPSTAHAGYLLRVNPDWDYVKALRDMWDGPLVLKGICARGCRARGGRGGGCGLGLQPCWAPV